MRVIFGRKLTMAERVLAFCRQQPVENPDYQALVSQLEQQIARARALDAQYSAGRSTVTAAAAHKARLRRAVREEFLRDLVRIADAFSTTEPGLDIGFTLPGISIRERAFSTAARNMLEQAAGRRELFVRCGMPATFVEDLTAALRAYDDAPREKTAGQAAHVGATADLKAIMHEIMGTVKRLNAMYRLLLRGNTERLAAWDSVRNIAWPTNEKPEAPAA